MFRACVDTTSDLYFTVIILLRTFFLLQSCFSFNLLKQSEMRFLRIGERGRKKLKFELSSDE